MPPALVLHAAFGAATIDRRHPSQQRLAADGLPSRCSNTLSPSTSSCLHPPTVTPSAVSNHYPALAPIRGKKKKKSPTNTYTAVSPRYRQRPRLPSRVGVGSAPHKRRARTTAATRPLVSNTAAVRGAVGSVGKKSYAVTVREGTAGIGGLPAPPLSPPSALFPPPSPLSRPLSTAHAAAVAAAAAGVSVVAGRATSTAT